MDFEKTENQYAALYNVSTRTVRRWKAKGWPLDNEEETGLLLAKGNEPHAKALTRRDPQRRRKGRLDP